MKEEDGNTQSYIWDNTMLFMEENSEGYSYLNNMQGSTMRLLDHSGQRKGKEGTFRKRAEATVIFMMNWEG